MKQSTMSTCSSKSGFSQCNKPTQFLTIPIHGNLQESLPYMTEQQVNFNLIELNLVSMYNKQILEKLYDWSIDTKFYLKNRYLLESILNGVSKTAANKKDVKEIVEKYDSMYVNGKPYSDKAKDSYIIKHGLKKQLRAKFISSREEFVTLLEELSQDLKQTEKTIPDHEDLHEYFCAQLNKINACQVHASVSPNKLQLMKSASMESISSQDSQDLEEISNQSFDTEKSEISEHCIFTMYFHDQIHHVKSINAHNSKFVRTKNRFPLILDLNFAKFIYKNDNQLSHELIAMSLMRYINRLLSGVTDKQQIIEYEIIPEAYGAFYEFVENSKTVGKIKAKFPGGIPEYLNYLEEQSLQNSQYQMSSIRKRFAETYAGFCLVQYLLDLKDRNNENIMIGNDGSIFHIDLAFIFNATPGGINFENCPFKFPKEYLQALGGFDSDAFKYFESLMMSNMTKLCINKEELFSKISILSARQDEIACFRKFKIENFKNKIPKKVSHVHERVQKIIDESYDNWRTKKYDDYQFKTNGILA